MYRGDGGMRRLPLLGSRDGPAWPSAEADCTSVVKAFIKRQKNDAADAEAIVEAAQRPTIRFVEPKTGGAAVSVHNVSHSRTAGQTAH